MKQDSDLHHTLAHPSDILQAHNINLITDPSMARQVVAQLPRDQPIGLDIETSKIGDHPQAGLLPQVSKIRLVQLCYGETVWVIDCRGAGLAWVYPLSELHLVAHNAKFELQHFLQAGIDLPNLDCSLLLARCTKIGLDNSLAACAKHLGVDLDKTLQVSDWSGELTREQIEYAALDAILTLALWNALPKEEPSVIHPYMLLRAVLPAVARQPGICIDLEAHSACVASWEHDMTEALAKLAEVGLTNPSSSKQKADYLERTLGVEELASWPRTPKGQLSTKGSDVEHLPELGTYTQAKSRLATYGPPLLDLSVGGNIYPQFKIAGAASGRFISSKPNFQNLPREGVRHIFRPSPGKVWIGCDLSQVELRVAALVSGDEEMLKAYRDGADLHTITALAITGKKSISKDDRQLAKAINFGLIFGASAKTLQKSAQQMYRIDLSLDEAMGFKRAFHNRYRQLANWQEAVVQQARVKGYSETVGTGLRRYYTAAQLQDHRFANQAVNHPIQGSAAELLLFAMQEAHLPIIHHTHDELWVECDPELVPMAKADLTSAFELAYDEFFPGHGMRELVEMKDVVEG